MHARLITIATSSTVQNSVALLAIVLPLAALLIWHVGSVEVPQ